ncbi:MAG: hypothetical protein WCW52_09955 [Elusimicrobiales bacterium]|jgi:hypothetical protein
MFKKPAEDDCVDAEIVSGPGARREGAGDGNAPGHKPSALPFYGLFLRLKVLLISAMLLAGVGLIILGLILTSTFIGAIIGIPLLLIGGLLLWLLFKLLTLGQKNQSFVFRRF